MLPTMYYYGILVATLLAVGLGEDLPSSEPLKPLDKDKTNSGLSSTLPHSPDGLSDGPIQMSDFCFFGRFPSATCRFKCHLMNKEAYCDEDKKKCLCAEEREDEEGSQELFETPAPPQHPSGLKDGKPTSTPEPTQTFAIPMHNVGSYDEDEHKEEEANKKHHVVFYIFDLNKIFGPSNPNATESAAAGTTEGTQTESSETAGAPGVAPAGWAFQHFVALLIVLLLSVLILLELFACYKKQRSKHTDMETIFKTIPMPNKA